MYFCDSKSICLYVQYVEHYYYVVIYRVSIEERLRGVVSRHLLGECGVYIMYSEGWLTRDG